MNLRLKKNKYSRKIDAMIDLHGYTKDEAEAMVREFIRLSEQRNYQYVKIVTGLGQHSASGHGVLKEFIQAYLYNHALEYRVAKISEGGEGALIVDLR